MDREELLARVRELRGKGYAPKEIARALGLPPSKVTPLVKAVAAEAPADPAEREVVGCWVTPGWSIGLTVQGDQGWIDDVDGPDSGTSGLVSVLLARDAGRGKVSACVYLVDVYCLGVKDTIGPRVMDAHRLPEFSRKIFSAHDLEPLAVPLDFAQHLVLGAVEYARGLGFEPAHDSDFDKTKGHLGTWTGPSAITFGREGKPFFIQGPRDNADRIWKTLESSVGRGNFEFSMVAL